MSRKHDRRHVLKLVFQMEFIDNIDPAETISEYYEAFKDLEKTESVDTEFVEKEFCGVIEYKEKLDAAINESTSGWHVSRISKTDLAILRLGIYEMLYNDDVPVGVAINEAVELAKVFSSDDSPSFINGILSRIEEDKIEKPEDTEKNE